MKASIGELQQQARFTHPCARERIRIRQPSARVFDRDVREKTTTRARKRRPRAPVSPMTMYLNRYAYDMTRASHARERVRRWARKGTHEFVSSPRRGGARLATEETNAFDGAFRRVRAARDHTRCYIIQNICDVIQNIYERGAVVSVTALCHSPQGRCRVAVRAWRSRPGPCLFGGER